jgi:hypothetical protein
MLCSNHPSKKEAIMVLNEEFYMIHTHPPQGLKLVNDKPGHYCVAPTQNMPVDLYKGLLEQMGLKAQKAWMKAA